MLRLAAERDTLAVIDDQIGSPTGAELLADVTAHALLRTLATPALAGTYHCTAAGHTSWHGYAQFVIAQALAAGVALKTAPDAVKPVSTTAYPTPAQRPLNSRLDTRRVQEAFGLVLPAWQPGVQRMLTEHLSR
jgi:dTDP-4-dehydrorhamnose reductase